jgi:hypothetical protein
MHLHRVWAVSDLDCTPEELADKLAEHSWTLCTGFRCGDVYWLNDATSEDGAQEYAIVRVADLVQIDSITASWCDKADLIGYARQYGRGAADFNLTISRLAPANIAHPSGSCHLCA